MWNKALKFFDEDKLELDPYLNQVNDLRRGIGLYARPDKSVLKAFNKFINEAKNIEPDQYFYNTDEIHMTVLTIISCTSEFKLSQISIPEYINQIEDCLSDAEPFKVKFRGITASPSCILIQGFPCNNSLELIRNNLRAHFSKCNLYHSIDKRYQIKTAHCTIIRYKNHLLNKKVFVDFLMKNRDVYFGEFCVSELELVSTDWYNKKENVCFLHKFKL